MTATAFAPPEHLVARFRTVAFARLERIDATWVELTQGTATPHAEQQMYRDLHTLKGDARVIGFGDVALLCQRLEDLLFAARGRRYHVHEDVDIVVTMAVQFVGMLLRKKVGAPRIGIDLEGFVKQIEEVIGEWLRQSSEAPGLSVPVAARPRLADMSARMSTATREKLSVAATTVYLEHLRATGSSKARLRDVWTTLAREVRELEAMPIAPLLERHAAAALDLAKELGKSLEVSTDAEGVRVTTEVYETLNTALLHCIRNAVDHAIEPPEERQARQKPATGMIRIRGAYCDDTIEFVIADDGAGVDLARVRERAVAKRLLSAEAAAHASDAELIELLFKPGFSIREHAGDVSGRGIGMDAVREAVTSQGGRVAFETLAGAGTTVTLSVPQLRSVLDVHVFSAVGAPLQLAVPASWSVEAAKDASAAMDPLDALDLASLRGAWPRDAPITALTLKRDGVALTVRGGAPVISGAARRLCATPADALAEIVELGGKEAVLIRPDALNR